MTDRTKEMKLMQAVIAVFFIGLALLVLGTVVDSGAAFGFGAGIMIASWLFAVLKIWEEVQRRIKLKSKGS